MNALNKKENNKNSSNLGTLALLIFSALGLVAHLVYLYLTDAERFPVNTVKVAASYEHVKHKDLESILVRYVNLGFFSLSLTNLQKELNEMEWIDTAYIERVWPDTLKIKLVEKSPLVIWNDALMTANGNLFKKGSIPEDIKLPRLKGPPSMQLEVLQVYEKLSKILSGYQLKAEGLYLRDNHAWILILENNIKIYLGKNELEVRLERFCKAYPAVFAAKIDQLASVDLRYPRGMAVQWKQQTGQ